MPIERAKESINYINRIGKEEGLDFKNNTAKPTNTFNAHRLVKYVEKKEIMKIQKKLLIYYMMHILLKIYYFQMINF